MAQKNMIQANLRQRGCSTDAKAYATTDLSLSAFLQARGHQLIDVRNEACRGIFVFPDSQRLRQDILRWGNNETVSIRVRGFVNVMRDLKGLVGI